MQKEVTGQRILKLPVWAQDHIKELERERETAIRALNEYVDGQTESPIYYDDMVSTGEERGPSSKRVYVQSRNIEIAHGGVHLEVDLRGEVIAIKWEDANKAMANVAFVPTSFHAASLISKENMR